MNEKLLRPNFKRRLPHVHLGGGLYRHATDQRRFYERPYVRGRQTWRRLTGTTERAARLELGKKRADQARAKFGMALDPYARADVQTVDELAQFYLEAGCPQRDQRPREGKQLKEEIRRVGFLTKFFKGRPWSTVNLEDCREYARWRMKLVQGPKSQVPSPKTSRVAPASRGSPPLDSPPHRPSGERTVDMEMVTLSAIFRWAQRNARRTGVTSNPVHHDRMRFRQASAVRHARDMQPANADELHALAAYLFGDPQSEVLGWVLLFQAFIGQRVHEIVRLRMDAQNDSQAGYVRGKRLYLWQSTNHKGTYWFAEIHPALKQCLEAHRAWHARKAQGPKSRVAPASRGSPTLDIGLRTLDSTRPSPWYFPSPFDPMKAVTPGALTKALRRICPAVGVPLRTSHGLRSYFVNVLRSQGIPDAEIALRIGHKSAGKLIVDVYGEIKDQTLTWLPADKPAAWAKWTGAPVMIQEEFGF